MKDLIILLEDLDIDYTYNKKLSMVDFEHEGGVFNVVFEAGGVIMLNGNFVTYKELIYSIF
jgi:hypothetical protein